MNDDEWRKIIKNTALQSIINNDISKHLSVATIGMSRFTSILEAHERNVFSFGLNLDKMIKPISFRSNLIDGNISNIVKDMNFATSKIASFSDVFGRYESLLSSNVSKIPELKSLVDPSFFNAVTQITRITNSLPKSVLRQVEINAISRQIKLSEIQTMIATISDIDSSGEDYSDSFDDQKDNLNKVVDFYIERIKDVSSSIELKYILDMAIVTIISIMIASYYHNDALREAGLSEVRLKASIENELEESKNSYNEAMEAMSRLQENMDLISQKFKSKSTVFYRVKSRPVELFVDNINPEEDYVTWLYPDQMVELIERNKKWIRVIAYDPLTNTTHVGWVMKKYLKIVN